MIGGVDDVGVVGDAERLELVEDLADGDIHVGDDGGVGDGFDLLAGQTGGGGGVGFGERVDLRRAAVVRHLHVEGLTGGHRPLHEGRSTLGDEVGLGGVRVVHVCGATVRSGAIAFIEAIDRRVDRLARMPLAVVGRCIALPAEEAGDGVEVGREVDERGRRRHCAGRNAVACALGDEGHVELRR